MSVTWRQGRVTQVICLPEEAGCFPGSSGAVFHTAWVPSTASSLHPCPRKWADRERVVGCQRAWEDHLHARSSNMASPVMPGSNGEMWRRLGTAGLMTFLPAHSHPANSFLFLCVLALAPFWKGQPAVQTECVPLSNREYLGTKNTY